jgi:CRP-like cAMP-binding protein
MFSTDSTSRILPSIRSFKRREFLPDNDQRLWQIEAGAVRTYTMTEDGTIITLGFWEAGDCVGQPLVCIEPYGVECLTPVKARSLPPEECADSSQLLLSHLHQTQALLQIRSGQIYPRLRQLLDLLASKFGEESDRGQLIRLRLTHQEIADTIGTTRVTITRLLNQLEHEGNLRWIKRYILLPHSSGRSSG